MALKPVPKAILIIAVVGAVGFGINFGLSAVKSNKPVEQPVAAVEHPPIFKPADTVAVDTPAPVSAPIQPTTDPSVNRGLDAVLAGGRR
jgi:hypothetical protein